MLAYLYQCLTCQTQDTRIGGVDDHVAICELCGHAMIRQHDDIFTPYFDKLDRWFKLKTEGEPLS